MRTDPEIAGDSVQELEHHVLTPADKIKVTARNGWVTLEGMVDWQYQKNLAESAVRKLRGVIGITNNIEIKPRVAPAQVQNKNRRGAEAQRRNPSSPR
jgi:osmotically-inducible protein OsmY